MSTPYAEDKKLLCDLFMLLEQSGNKITKKALEAGGYSDPYSLLEAYKLSRFSMETAHAAVNCHPFERLLLADNGEISYQLSDAFIKLLKVNKKWEIIYIENSPTSDHSVIQLRAFGADKAAKPSANVLPVKFGARRKWLIAGVAGGLVLLVLLFVAVSMTSRPKVESYKAFLTTYLTSFNSAEPISLLKLENIDKESAYTYTVTYSFVEGLLAKEQEADTTKRTFKRIWIALQPVDNDRVAKGNKEPLAVFVVREYKELPLEATN